MGTNYYLIEPPLRCPTCGHPDPTKPPPERRHIGKSSGGWVFALHVYPKDGIHDLADWLPLLCGPNAKIVDEYGKTWTLADMVATITRRWWGGPSRTAEWYIDNNANEGPDGLARSRSARPGAGTWDCHTGDFS